MQAPGDPEREKRKLILLQKFRSFWMEKNLFETQGRLEEIPINKMERSGDKEPFTEEREKNK